MDSRLFFYAHSTRQDGDMRDRKNIDVWMKRINFPNRQVLLMNQIHSSNVNIVNKNKNKNIYPDIDGLVAKNSSCILGVKTADCVPLLFFDEMKKIFSAVHAGWRGVFSEIAKEAILKMQQQGSEKKNIFCIVGPHIQVCCYNVSEERALTFKSKYNTLGQVVNKKAVHLSLQEIIVKQLADIGVVYEHIHSSFICTCCNANKYFSYRKDSKETFGEQLSIIGMN